MDASADGVIETADSIALAERQLNTKWDAKLKKDMPDAHPINYFVPNFGLDASESGVEDSRASIKQAERQLGVTWDAQVKAAKPHPAGYTVPNFGLDENIKTSLSNLKTAEKKYGQWDLPKDD